MLLRLAVHRVIEKSVDEVFVTDLVLSFRIFVLLLHLELLG